VDRRINTDERAESRIVEGAYERVHYVVELLDEPIPIQEIAERAGVSRTTADDELGRLASDDWVVATTINSKKAYDLNPVWMLFDEISTLINEHSRKELERDSSLRSRKSERNWPQRRYAHVGTSSRHGKRSIPNTAS
jgi:hypothetical protein